MFSSWYYIDSSAVESNLTIYYNEFNDWGGEYGIYSGDIMFECEAQGVEYAIFEGYHQTRQLYHIQKGVLWMSGQYLDFSGLNGLNVFHSDSEQAIEFPSFDSTSCGEFDFEFWDLSCGSEADWKILAEAPTPEPTTVSETTTTPSVPTDPPLMLSIDLMYNFDMVAVASMAVAMFALSFVSPLCSGSLSFIISYYIYNV